MDWKQLDEYTKEEPSLTEFLINIYLVCQGGRDATLIEPYNFSPSQEETNRRTDILEIIMDQYIPDGFNYKKVGQRILFASNQNIVEYENSPTDLQIGKLLGMKCYQHNFSDSSVNRTALHISVQYKDQDISIYTELCESDLISLEQVHQHAKTLVTRMKQAEPRLQPVYDISLIPSVNHILDQLKQGNLKYVEDNIHLYLEIFYNYWTMNSIMEERFVSYINGADYGIYDNNLFYKFLLHIWKSEYSEERAIQIDQSIQSLENLF